MRNESKAALKVMEKTLERIEIEAYKTVIKHIEQIQAQQRMIAQEGKPERLKYLNAKIEVVNKILRELNYLVDQTLANKVK